MGAASDAGADEYRLEVIVYLPVILRP